MKYEILVLDYLEEAFVYSKAIHSFANEKVYIIKKVFSKREVKNSIQQSNVCLIIINWDVNTKEVNEILESIKFNKNIRHIPVLIISENINDKQFQSLLIYEAIDYVKNPIDDIEFYSRANNLIEVFTTNLDLRRREDLFKKQTKILNKLSIASNKTENSVLIINNDGEIEWANEGFKKLSSLKIRITIFSP
mgnify:CR=1 FL=1